MHIIYNLGIRIYWFLAILSSPFNAKARLFVKGRKGWFEQLKINFTPSGKKVIWMHVSSLGEFEQGRPLIEKVKDQLPNYKILLTFFSPSGYEIRKNYPLADYICYLPVDTSRNAKKFLSYIQPDISIFVKYDFWFNAIRWSKKLHSDTILISGIFRKNQLFFKPYGNWYRKQLKNFNHFFLQDENSAKLLSDIGLTNTSICGDSRMDRVVQIAENNKDIALIKTFAKDNLVLVGGSTWPPDEELLFSYLQNSKSALKYILAPHDISESHLKNIEENAPVKTIRFSQANETTITQHPILIIDSIGMLSTLYRYGAIAYIGGGFGVSIHNTLEAAVYGIPVIFGPTYHKFKEAVDMIEQGGAFTIDSIETLTSVIDALINDKNHLKEVGNNAKNYIYQMSGATKIIYNYIADSK